jgi:hypothetical protein
MKPGTTAGTITDMLQVTESNNCLAVVMVTVASTMNLSLGDCKVSRDETEVIVTQDQDQINYTCYTGMGKVAM